MSALPVELASRLSRVPEERRWLLEGLWAAEAVGIVGGEPKCCKSFLGLDMAVAVASGRPCLRHFRAAQTGRVLLFAAEDALHVVRERLEGICSAAAVALDALDIRVITAPSLRLDLEADRCRLIETIEGLRPRLLLLDPFVRLHRIDENVSSEVAPLLGFLREIQRRFQVAVVLVHHARKGAAQARDGQALRGSSEFHAWGDSNLYLRRRGDDLFLSIEHRAAPSTTGIAVDLKVSGAAVALTLAAPAAPPPEKTETPLTDVVERALAELARPMSVAALRRVCRTRTQNICEALALLRQRGTVVRTSAGYQLAAR